MIVHLGLAAAALAVAGFGAIIGDYAMVAVDLAIAGINILFAATAA